MSTPPGTEDAVAAARRKHIFTKFAQLNVRDRQRRLLPLEENSSETGTHQWLTGSQKSKYDQDEMAYTIPYKAEYQLNAPTSNANILTNVIVDEPQPGTSGAQSVEEDATSVTSRTTEADTVSSLPTIRGRLSGRRGRGPLSSKSSVIDFERTSTVQPPSEISPDDYTSNISIEELRKDYFSGYKTNTELPIYSQRAYLINSINSYGIVIIEGATGCGKTTQIPAYILEDAILERKSGHAPVIYVTQPRRIAARSIAHRVCSEHGWSVGSIVGFQVGLEKRVGPQTVLVFCTAGVLLQKLIQEKSLKSFTHIIIDEAHERDADTDLLMMMIRTLMRNEMSFFHLIIMSATMDVSKLKAYFTFKTSYGHRPVRTPSICKVGQEKRPTNIQIIYFDKLRTTFQVDEPMPTFDLESPDLHEECVNAAVKIIIDVIPHLDTFSEATKSTLVFLPGLAEISKMDRHLKAARANLEIIPLHSCISVIEQHRVFEPGAPGTRKVILATNIAESSITVPDVGFIIDFCLTKSLRKDEVTRFPTLKLCWSTADKCTQRAGRTGRCCPGKVFRMVSNIFFQEFSEYAEPELLTAPLELSVLRVKNFQMGEVKALMAVVPDPPPFNEIRTAILELKQIGALSSTYEGKLSDIDGDLTELGKIISFLPIDVHLSKLIVVASLLDVLEDAIIVAGCLSTNRTVVKHLYGNLLESYDNKLNWSHGSYSDLIVSLDVYKEYIHQKEDLNKTQVYLEKFCHQRKLDEKKLHEVSSLVEEIKNRLLSVNIRVYDQPNRVRDCHEDELMLKIAFCASFYPNYFLTQQLDAQEIKKELCGLDPTKTVIVHSIPINQVPLYRTQIVDQLKEKVCAGIDFIADCSRALLVLNDNNKLQRDEGLMSTLGGDGVILRTQEIERSVYMALKLGECEKLCIREFKEEIARDRMQYYKDERAKIESNHTGRLLPALTKIVKGRDADNTRLTEATNEEYAEISAHTYYLEVALNERQDRRDLSELWTLEEREEERLRSIRKSNGKNDLEDEPEHPIYKREYKYLGGPSSPIRMTFRSVLEKSKGFAVDLDSLSVNSILLDPDYEKDRRQMLVAASVCQTRRSKIMARDTTLMPNIRGLPTLMALMFAQYYRLVYNEQTKCIAGAIFGLGWDEEDKPINKQYEVELSFDIHINKDDIDLINKARRNISELLRGLEIYNPGSPRALLQEQLRQIILTLIRKRRYGLPEISISNVNWQNPGPEFVRDKHNVPKEQVEKLEEGRTRAFLPIMEVTRSYSELDLFLAIRKNLDQLGSIAACEERPPIGGIRCLLCGSGGGSFLFMHNQIVNHLSHDSHLEKLQEFEIFEERASRGAR